MAKFQHTAARRRLQNSYIHWQFHQQFQHTAARRRLLLLADVHLTNKTVSTHSRAEAAAFPPVRLNITSPGKFQHTAARRRLPLNTVMHCDSERCFNTQPRGGGCES